MSNLIKSISEQLPSVRKRMQEAGFDPQAIARETSFAMQIIMKDARLQECERNSILAAIVNVANLGLTLNPAAKEAALIARYDSRIRGNVCVLDPMYPGLLRLAKDAGAIAGGITGVVYEADIFRLDKADSVNPISHNPCLISSKKGAPIGVYCLLTLPNGLKQPEWMDMEQVREIRNRSDAWQAFAAGKIKSTPWATDELEMARKTVLKRGLKYAPRGTNDAQNRLDAAIEATNQEFPASTNQLMQIELLSRTANISPERSNEIYQLTRGRVSQGEAASVIQELEDAQIDDARYMGITSGADAKKAVATATAADKPTD
jgi:recombination protein RecT